MPTEDAEKRSKTVAVVQKVQSAGIGFILAVIGLVLVVVLAVIGRLDTLHAVLFGLAFLSILL